METKQQVLAAVSCHQAWHHWQVPAPDLPLKPGAAAAPAALLRAPGLAGSARLSALTGTGTLSCHLLPGRPTRGGGKGDPKGGNSRAAWGCPGLCRHKPHTADTPRQKSLLHCQGKTPVSLIQRHRASHYCADSSWGLLSCRALAQHCPQHCPHDPTDLQWGGQGHREYSPSNLHLLPGQGQTHVEHLLPLHGPAAAQSQLCRTWGFQAPSPAQLSPSSCRTACFSLTPSWSRSNQLRPVD